MKIDQIEEALQMCRRNCHVIVFIVSLLLFMVIFIEFYFADIHLISVPLFVFKKKKQRTETLDKKQDDFTKLLSDM